MGTRKIALASQPEENEKTHLTVAIEKTSFNKEHLTVGDAIERVGCGFGSFLYVLAPYTAITLGGAEMALMSVVALMVRCEWDLSTFTMSALQMTDMGVYTIVSIFFSNFGDRYGRKPVMFISTFLTIIAGILSGFCTAPWQLFLCKAVNGATFGISFGPAAALSAEVPTLKYRALGLSSAGLGYGIGTAITNALAYTVGSIGWRGYVITVAGIFVPFLILMLFIRESPRYDYQVGKFKEAKKTIRILSKLNCTGEKIDDIYLTDDPNSANVEEEMNSFYDSYKALKITGCILDFWLLNLLCFAAHVAYTGLMYVAPRLLNEGYCHTTVFNAEKSCVFDNSALASIAVVGLSEPLGIVLGLLIGNYVGRLKILLASAILPILTLALLYICAGRTYMVIILFITRAIISVLSNIILIIAGEYFPTRVRAFTLSVQGTMCSTATIAGIVCANYAYEANPVIVLAGMQAFLLISAVCAGCLKRETAGEQLDQ